MENKFVVPYETAKLLKDKGYDEKISFAYNKDKELIRSGSLDLNNTDWERLHDIERIHSRYMYPPKIVAPTYHEVLDWLKEKGIYITCYAPMLKPVGRYAISVFNSNTNNINDWGLCRDAYPTREEALNAGILAALKML